MTDDIDVGPSGVGARPKGEFGRAVRWAYVLDGGRLVATIVITFVLAALLGPAAYGTVAMASIYIMFIELLLKQGMVSAIVQRRVLGDDHVDSAFWMTFGTALVMTAVSVGLSGWWASVNDLPALRNVIIVLSVTFPLKGLVVVQEALLRRRMQFRSLAIRTNVSVVAGGVIGVIAALAGAEVWALVTQQIATSLIGVVVLWSVSEWRPRLRFSTGAARDLLGFSIGSFLASVGVFINNRADALLMGIFFGPVAVGLYRLAFRVVDMVVDVLSRSLQSVALPELARLQDVKRAFGKRTLEVISLSAVLAFPVLGVIAVGADALMQSLGEEWEPAVGALQILCVVSAIRALILFNAPMLQALGRPHLLAAFSWFSALLSAGTLAVVGALLQDSSSSTQVVGMALSRMGVFAVYLFISAWMLVKMCDVSVVALVTALRPAVLATLVGGALAVCAHLLLSLLEVPPLVILVGVVAAGTAGIAGAIYAWAPEYRRHAAFMWSRVRSVRDRRPGIADIESLPDAEL